MIGDVLHDTYMIAEDLKVLRETIPPRNTYLCISDLENVSQAGIE